MKSISKVEAGYFQSLFLWIMDDVWTSKHTNATVLICREQICVGVHISADFCDLNKTQRPQLSYILLQIIDSVRNVRYFS